MSKATPGPWKWDGDDLWHFGSGYERETGDQPDPHRYTGIKADRRLAGSEILDANMAMVAAAPDLLAELKAMVDEMAHCAVVVGDQMYAKVRDDYRAKLRERIAAARAAISKATN